MTQPVVSVVLPFYRNPLVVEAVESILSQTLADLEVIAVDDGSDNGVAELLSTITDPRFHLVVRPSNGGVSAARNDGVRLAKGRYIAFQDSDDISYPTRLERQVEALEANPSLVGCGSACHYGDGKRNHVLPGDAVSLRWEMIFNSHVIFPTVMVRSAVAKENPFPEIPASEDYLWLHQVMRSGDFLNLPEILFHYRMQQTSLSKLKVEAQIANGNRCRSLFAADAGFDCTPRQVELLEWLGWPRHEAWPSVASIEEAADLLGKLAESFVRRHPDRTEFVHSSASARLRYATTISADLGPGAYFAWRALAVSGSRSRHDASLLLKCALRGAKALVRKAKS